MDECKSCGKDMDRQGTHWDGCHTSHKQCAAFKAGREAGMREAAELLNDARFVDRALEHWKPGDMKAPFLADAILSAIGEGK